MRRKRPWNKFRTGGWVPRPGQSRIFIKRPCVWYITHDNPAGGRGVWNRKPKPGGRGSARVLHTRAPKLARPSFNSNFYLYESCIIVSPLERRRLRAPCSIPSPPRSSLYYQPDFSRERNFKPRSMLLVEVLRRGEKMIISDSHVSEIDCRIHLSEDSNLS